MRRARKNFQLAFHVSQPSLDSKRWPPSSGCFPRLYGQQQEAIESATLGLDANAFAQIGRFSTEMSII
jgi:hypothetical protein